MKIICLTYNNIALISAPKIHTNLLWDLTILFAVIGVLYFTIIFFFRNKLGANSKRRIQKKKELSPMVSEFLFYEGEEGTKEERSTYVNLKIEIRELIKDPFHRQILSEILLDLQVDLSGNTRKRLFKLYKDLGLHLDAFEKLKSWRWERVSKGILELTKMQVEESYSFITKYINDRRSVVRKQAEIAVVTLKKGGINYFLDNTQYRVSQWQQLKLLDVIRNREDYKPPRFKAWLTSKNKDVVLFALRLIKHYNQNDAKSSMVELVKHKNNQIKIEALDCIKKFHITEAIDTLKVIFKKSSVDIKLQILDVMSDLGTENDISFVQKVSEKETNFNVKSKALSVINAISPETILPTEGIEKFAKKLDELEKNTVDEDYWVDKDVNSNIPAVNEELKDLSNNLEDENDSTEDILNVDSFEVLELEEEVYVPVFDEKDILASTFLPVVSDSENVIDANEEVVGIDKEEEHLEVDFSFNDINEDVETQEEVALLEEDVKDDNTYEISNDIDTVIVESEAEETNFDLLFFNKDDYNKTLLLDTIEDANNEKDIPLLKEILENESNELIKGRAWEILKTLSEEEIYYNVNDNETTIELKNAVTNSVFVNLFKVSDIECKLMLLDEMLDLADEKEIPFLNTLLTDSNKEIKIKAANVIVQIKEKSPELEEVIVEEESIDRILQKELKPLKSVDFNTDEVLNFSKETIFVPKDDVFPDPKTVEENNAFNIKNSKDLLPLEFCFVLDKLDIELPKPFSVFDIDFELNERNSTQENKEENSEEIKHETTNEEQSLLEQILSLPSKIRDKLSG